MSLMNRLGILTDEVSPELNEALNWIRDQGLKHVEIRVVNGVNIADLDDAQADEIRIQVEKRGLFVSAVASPLFKCALDPSREVASGDTFGQKEESVEAHRAKLHRVIAIGKRLGTRNIRVFSFWREQQPLHFRDEVIAHLKQAADVAEEQGMRLLLENEPVCNGGFAIEVGEIARAVNSASLRVLWDPGNEVCGGEAPFPAGYEQVKDVLGHVHLKDAYWQADGSPRCVPIGSGSVPFLAQLKRLEQDGYDGLYTIETHFAPLGASKLTGSAITLAALRLLVQELEQTG